MARNMESIESRGPEQEKIDAVDEIVRDQANLDPEYVERGLEILKSESGYQWTDAEGHLAGRIFIDKDGKLKELKRPVETHRVSNVRSGITDYSTRGGQIPVEGVMVERGEGFIEEGGKEKLQAMKVRDIEFAQKEKEKLTKRLARAKSTRGKAEIEEEIERYEGDIEIAKGMIIAVENLEK